MFKKSFLALIVSGIIIAGAIIIYFSKSAPVNTLDVLQSASPSVWVSPSQSATPKPNSKSSVSSSGNLKASPIATPKKDSLINSPVPWEKLSGEAFCELKGEIKFVSMSPRTYDNQDARFIYKGVDHPGRLINWTVSPDDGLVVGPNIFSSMPLPDGESLVGVRLPENPKYKSYELSATITYGRLVDGNVKIFTKNCVGKTVVVLP